MASLGAILLLMVVGLLLMAVVASFVSAIRKYLQPKRNERYYSYVAGVLFVVAGGLWLLSPPPTTAVGLYVTFGSSFAVALAVLYTALAVYIAQRGADDSGGGEPEPEPNRDRPLSQR